MVKNKLLLVSGVTGILTFGSSVSLAYVVTCPDLGAVQNGCDLPNTTAGSYPYFDNVVSVNSQTKNDGTVKLQAKGYKGSLSNFFVISNDPDTGAIPVEKMKYSLKAQIQGGELSGKVSIKGALNGEKIQMTADLMGGFDASPDHTLLGFDTANMECKGPDFFTSRCSTGEVAYLNLLEPINYTPGEKISTAGRALTSIPLPAAAWLFGSGLLGLIAVSRRKGAQG